jgi:hypothetical protein
MGKKNKGNPSQSKPAPEPSRPLVSKRGWKVILGGIGTLGIGYSVLSLADPLGQNWASKVSPFLILGGYAIIGLGIVTKDPSSHPTE